MPTDAVVGVDGGADDEAVLVVLVAAVVEADDVVVEPLLPLPQAATRRAIATAARAVRVLVMHRSVVARL